VHPEVLEAMGEVGVDLSGRTPQKLTDDLARGAQMLITMGCGEQCPVVPGLRRDDWPLEDPKDKPIARVREIRDDVRARVIALLLREGWARG
jgi:arsenate reductase